MHLPRIAVNRQSSDHVDGHESPALASSPHHSPRPRVARRGGAHAPPKGVLAGLINAHDLAMSVARAQFGLLDPKWFERRSGSLKPRATNTLRLPAGATPSLRPDY
jgi:hypothetical protein